MRSSRELRALLAALRSDTPAFQLRDGEWVSLVQMAVDAGIGQSMLSAGLPGIPEEQQRVLRTDALLAVARHLKTRADLAHITPVLQSTGVPWAVVKGPVLSEHWYAERGRRPYADLDVLVAGCGLRGVLDALQRAGCILLDTNWSLSLQQERAELTVLLPLGTSLDLHWSLLNTPEHRAAFPLNIAGMLERRQIVDVAGQSCPTLDDVDTLLHLCLHTVLSGGRRLAWYVDVSQVLHGFHAWDELVRRSHETRAGLVVAVALGRASRLTGTDVPERVLHRLVGRGRGWRAVVRGLDALRPLGDPRVQLMTGQLLVRSTRSATRSSVAALFQSLRRDLWAPVVHEPQHAWRSHAPADPATRSPLWDSAADPADQARYFRLAEVG